MKIILTKDIKNQGKKDDIKEVKPGYGEFLIKSGNAVLCTPKSLEILQKENELEKNKQLKIEKDAFELKQKLEKVSLKFKVKTGNSEKVFGNISSKQISEKLKELGFEIDKKKINIMYPLNTLGKWNVEVILHKNVTATLSIELEN